jgi:DNA primase
MGRIPDEEIERLKRESRSSVWCEARGVVLEKTRGNLVGRCPFHDDRRRRFVVTPERNLWHCLGACQAGGSVIDFVMKRGGGELPARGGAAACGAPLAARAGQERAAAEAHDGRQAASRWRRATARTRSCWGVVDHYHAALRREPRGARQYVRARGISAEAVGTSAGYANRTLGYRLPTRTAKAARSCAGS